MSASIDEKHASTFRRIKNEEDDPWNKYQLNISRYTTLSRMETDRPDFLKTINPKNKKVTQLFERPKADLIWRRQPEQVVFEITGNFILSFSSERSF